MNKTEYNQRAELVLTIIDVAIDCFSNHSSGVFGANDIKQLVKTYIMYRNKIINPGPRPQNIRTLNQIQFEVLVYFQEASGHVVKTFWDEIDRKQLAVKRVNSFEKILKRGKIKNHNEYDIIIDSYNSYIETNMLSDNEREKINGLISNFENRKVN